MKRKTGLLNLSTAIGNTTVSTTESEDGYFATILIAKGKGSFNFATGGRSATIAEQNHHQAVELVQWLSQEKYHDEENQGS